MSVKLTELGDVVAYKSPEYDSRIACVANVGTVCDVNAVAVVIFKTNLYCVLAVINSEADSGTNNATVELVTDANLSTEKVGDVPTSVGVDPE